MLSSGVRGDKQNRLHPCWTDINMLPCAQRRIRVSTAKEEACKPGCMFQLLRHLNQMSDKITPFDQTHIHVY